MKFLSSPRFLAAYSGVLTVAFAAVVLGGAAMVRNQTFGVITARRINIVEPDGTVRLAISNRADSAALAPLQRADRLVWRSQLRWIGPRPGTGR